MSTRAVAATAHSLSAFRSTRRVVCKIHPCCMFAAQVLPSRRRWVALVLSVAPGRIEQALVHPERAPTVNESARCSSTTSRQPPRRARGCNGIALARVPTVRVVPEISAASGAFQAHSDPASRGPSVGSFVLDGSTGPSHATLNSPRASMSTRPKGVCSARAGTQPNATPGLRGRRARLRKRHRKAGQRPRRDVAASIGSPWSRFAERQRAIDNSCGVGCDNLRVTYFGNLGAARIFRHDYARLDELMPTAHWGAPWRLSTRCAVRRRLLSHHQHGRAIMGDPELAAYP